MIVELTGFALGLDIGYVLNWEVRDDSCSFDLSKQNMLFMRRENLQKPVWELGPDTQFCTC